MRIIRCMFAERNLNGMKRIARNHNGNLVVIATSDEASLIKRDGKLYALVSFMGSEAEEATVIIQNEPRFYSNVGLNNNILTGWSLI